MYFPVLILLGMFFRLLRWHLGGFDGLQFTYVIIVEGAISGAGVASGILLLGHLIKRKIDRDPEFDPDKWYFKIIPYICGGFAALLGKLYVRVADPSLTVGSRNA